ncbi:MAG: biotin--[acetyl-CoA-carboxylase] ligase [Eubacteriales bacterium]|nr:biotin--[acetyl-CoA-carboxylase] ligase [Eubacteriales bacterium]MDD3882396.1 biotin--[acetyl-CoA-carboxylase] ligase [Eubacteriales bacterium]MDD4512383.1 biotin--[acetyl-CoA-carboxylase] ligase [Eubacteriales bacterium]
MDRILELLQGGGFVSGEAIAREMGISRAAVWKRIDALRAGGFPIISSGKRGYSLDADSDALLPELVRLGLETSLIGKSLDYSPVIGSTNKRGKEKMMMGGTDGLVVYAGEQTSGRGRLQREWISPKDAGVYMTICLRPFIPPEKAPFLTMLAAVAVSRAIKAQTGLSASLKWPNDVIISGKKVCGILSEMAAEPDKLEYAVVGIGINVNQLSEDFPQELKARATSLRIEADRKFRRADIIRAVISEADELYAAFLKSGESAFIGSFRENCVTIGSRVNVSGAVSITGTAVDMDETGALIVKDDGGKAHRVMAGDVSVRGVMGYA